MDLTQCSKVFKELGHYERMKVFQVLSDVGDNGITVGELRVRLRMNYSTLSNYLSRLMQVGLVKQVRDGKCIRYSANYEIFGRTIVCVCDCCGQGFKHS